MLQKVLIRGAYSLVLLFCVLATAGIGTLLESKQLVYEKAETVRPSEEIGSEPFPVSVRPLAKAIVEEDLLNNNAFETLAIEQEESNSFASKLVAFLFKREWYQNLASPVSRILVIWPGERKEEVAKNIGDILRWDQAQRAEFVRLISLAEPTISEGKFYPGQYVAHRSATPEEVASMIQDKFTTDVLNRYTPEVEAQVPITDALIIASLLEREASDFENMREVSGVIWNRLFINMPLQLDATLQYVRGAKPSEKNWWPTPKPADKYLDSPYNTYAYKGLPPGPISNASAAAILAALNPYPTDCLYYFHDSEGDYHCSVTYEEHVANLKIQYGRGS